MCNLSNKSDAQRGENTKMIVTFLGFQKTIFVRDTFSSRRRTVILLFILTNEGISGNNTQLICFHLCLGQILYLKSMSRYESSLYSELYTFFIISYRYHWIRLNCLHYMKGFTIVKIFIGPFWKNFKVEREKDVSDWGDGDRKEDRGGEREREKEHESP